MNRMAYRLSLATGWLMCGALIAAPVWDRWYYHSGPDARAFRAPLGVIVAYPVVSPVQPELPLPPTLGPTTTTGTASQSPGRATDVRASAATAGTRDATGDIPVPSRQPPVMAAPSRPGIARGKIAPVTSRVAPATQVDPKHGDTRSSGSSPAWMTTESVVAGFQAPSLQISPPSNQSMLARSDLTARTDINTADGQAPEPAPPGQGPLRLTLVPLKASVSPGELLSVAVLLDGADRVTSVPFHLQFDPKVLGYVGARTGPALNTSSLQSIFLASVNPSRPGDLAVGLSLAESSGTLSGSGMILVIDFRALAPGRSDLVFERASVRGPTSEPLPAEISGSAAEVH